MSSAFSYTAYGLSICATMPLPELPVGKAKEGEAVIIRFGRVDFPSPEFAHRDWGYSSPAPMKNYLFWKGVGSFLVSGGHEIVVDPASGTDERTLRLYILGAALAVLLHQRGRLTLHASAVDVAGEVVAFMGASGWGKSTAAAALHARGHSFVADDVTAVQVDSDTSLPMVFPGFPQLKLWPEAAVSLGEALEALPRLDPHEDKRDRRVGRGFSLTPLPLRRIYILNYGESNGIEPLRPQDALLELVRHSYCVGLLQGESASSHFLQCTSVINNVTISSLTRRRSLSALSDLGQLVEEDLARSPERGVLSAG